MTNLILFLTLLSASFLSAHSFNNLCPASEALQPCYCVSDGQVIRVDCMGVSSASEVKNALQSVKGTRRVFIDFIRAKFGKVPSDMFKGLHVTKISFSDSQLDEFGDAGRSALEGLEDTIEELTLSFSFPFGLKFLNISHLRALTDLEIEAANIKVLSNDWFKDGPVNLQTLYVMTNEIEELGDKAFASLTKLRNLWLTGNKFAFLELKRSMFPSPADHLTSLDLSNNELNSLPLNMFSGMPSLKEVILTDNYIGLLHETTWSPVWSQLTRVYLEENPLKCDSSIDWMFNLRRPFVLKGKCRLPDGRSNKNLKQIIDEKQMEPLLVLGSF